MRPVAFETETGKWGSRPRPCLEIPSMLLGLAISVPSKKTLHGANVCFVMHEAHATAQPCRHTNSKTFPKVEGLCDIYVPY